MPVTPTNRSPASASAPASSANLGPGFDAIALALDLRCRVEAVPAEDWSVTHLGPHGPDPGSDDAVLEAARLAVGSDRPLSLAVTNQIPLGRGLGSSSAAFAAGALAAMRAYHHQPSQAELFNLVAELEGHPDNAAAAVFGGFVIVDGRGTVHRLPWLGDLHPVVAVPARPFKTADARQILPGVYPADVVVRSLGRLGVLMMGLATADPVLLAGAAEDELHEEPRNRIRPDVEALLVAARSAGAWHACWSGAGPSVLALTTIDRRPAVIEALIRRLGGEGEVIFPEVATSGAE